MLSQEGDERRGRRQSGGGGRSPTHQQQQDGVHLVRRARGGRERESSVSLNWDSALIILHFLFGNSVGYKSCDVVFISVNLPNIRLCGQSYGGCTDSWGSGGLISLNRK